MEMIFFTLKKHLSSETAHSQKNWKLYMNIYNNRPEETNLNIWNPITTRQTTQTLIQVIRILGA